MEDLVDKIQEEVFGYSLGLNKTLSNSPFIPIPVMLEKSLSNIEDLEKFMKKYKSKKILCEMKYDGERT